MTIPTIISYPMPTANTFPAQKVNWPLNPKRAVFLIHDMQAYFLQFYDPKSDLIKTLKNNLMRIKAYCHSNNIPVIYTAQPKNQQSEDRALLNDMWGNGLNDFPELQKITDELTPNKEDTVLVKWRYSAFHRSDLQSLMQSWGRDQLIIGGIYANIGCMLTGADAFMRDIQPFLVGDALADFNEQEHRLALTYTANRIGRVISTDDILAITPKSDTTIQYDQLKTEIFAFLDDEDIQEFDPDEQLIDYGLDSIQIMSFISAWQAQGITVSFQELANAGTLNGWWQLLQNKQKAVA